MKTPHRSACLGLFALILQAAAPLSGMPAMQGASDPFQGPSQICDISSQICEGRAGLTR